MATENERETIVRSMMEAISSAHTTVNPMIMLPMTTFATYAHAALASLESAGFKVVRNA